MKKLMSLAIFAMTLLFTSVHAADEPVTGTGLTCEVIAEDYAREATRFFVYHHDLFGRVTSGANNVAEQIKDSTDKLSGFLKQHAEKQCDDANFVRTYGNYVFTDAEPRDAYLADMLDDSALTPEYCTSIRQSFNGAMIRSAIFGLTGVQTKMSQMSGRRDEIDILLMEGDTILPENSTKRLALNFGVPLLFGDVPMVSRETLENMSDEELQVVIDKAAELMLTYQHIENLQKVRFETFCPGQDIELTE